MFIKVIAGILVLLGMVNAKAGQDNIVDAQKIITAYTKTAVVNACHSVISDDCKRLRSFFPEHINSAVVVISTRIMKENVIAPEIKLNQVAYKGGIYYIKNEDLVLTQENQEKLELTPNWISNEAAVIVSNEIYLASTNEAFDSLKKIKELGVAILNCQSYDESDNTQGTGLLVDFMNISNKTIKYITATVIGYDAVGGAVLPGFSKSVNVILKGVGPIEPNKHVTYRKEYAWFTDSVSTAEIKTIKIEYMDGSTKLIKKPQLAKVDEKYSDLLSSEK